MRIPKKKVKLVTTGYLTLSDEIIHCPEDAYSAVFDRFSDDASETVIVLYLNVAGQIIEYSESNCGLVDACVVPMRELWQNALLTNAHSIIVIHNHPSGCLSPSEQDRKTAKDIAEMGKMFCVCLRDFIITGPAQDPLSFLREGLLK